MIYAFDLDGTVTREETLPLLARELGLYEEMRLLTELTMQGTLDFKQSFRLRYHVLKSIPIERVQAIMDQVELDKNIAGFIRERRASCAVVTGNLDVWIEPIIKKLGCRVFASVSGRAADGSLTLESVLDKGHAVRKLKKEDKVVAIGESYNDIPMFEEANYSIAYGGVHAPVETAISVADWVVYEGGALCALLRTL